MSNTTSYDIVAVCTPNEAKRLITTMVENYAKFNNADIEPKSNLLDLWRQIREIYYGLFRIGNVIYKTEKRK